MNWDAIKLAVNCLVIGFVLGYAWQPVWKFLRQFIYEAKKARNEWRQPRN